MSVCEHHLRWSVFPQPLLSQVDFWVCASCGSNEGCQNSPSSRIEAIRRGKNLRPAYSGVTQLRIAPASTSELINTMRSGRVPRGANKYCSCETRRGQRAVQASAMSRVGPCRHTRQRFFQKGQRIQGLFLHCRHWTPWTSDRNEWLAFNMRAVRHWSAQPRKALSSASVPAGTPEAENIFSFAELCEGSSIRVRGSRKCTHPPQPATAHQVAQVAPQVVLPDENSCSFAASLLTVQPANLSYKAKFQQPSCRLLQGCSKEIEPEIVCL